MLIHVKTLILMLDLSWRKLHAVVLNHYCFSKGGGVVENSATRGEKCKINVKWEYEMLKNGFVLSFWFCITVFNFRWPLNLLYGVVLKQTEVK